MNGKMEKFIVPLIVGLAVLALIGLFAREALRVAKVPKIEKVKEKTKEEIPSAEHFVASGKQVYEIITDKPRDPQIIEVEVDPLDVEIGKTQVVTVKVKTKADSVGAEDYVLGTAILDGKTIDFPLKLKKAEGKEELITTWQGEWKREFPIEKHYQIRIFVKNIKGEDSVTLSFGSACVGVPLGGDYTIDSTATGGTGGCTFAYSVDGVDNGNLTIASGYTLTVNSGQTVVWNPGKSIFINGSIAINKGTPGGQLKKTYLWAADVDSDTYYGSFVAQDSNPGGLSKRRSELTSWPSIFDCLDSGTGAQYVYQNIANLEEDKDHDRYTIGSAATRCVGDTTSTYWYRDTDGTYKWIATANRLGTSDCDDSNVNAWRYRYKDADNDGYCPGSTLYCVGNDSGYRDSCTAYSDCDDSNVNAWRYRYKDADNDGYCPGSTLYCVGNDSGYRDSCTTYTDCNDSDPARWQNRTCYYDGDNDGYRTTASATRCVGSDCTNSTDAYKRESTASIDCDDSTSAKYQNLTCYYDGDGDGVIGSNSATYCCGSACGTGCTGVSATAGSDCNDADPARWQNRTCYYDGDNDGYRTTASATRCVGSDCTNSTDAYKRESTAPVDCDDFHNTVAVTRDYYSDIDNDGYYVKGGSFCASVDTYGDAACSSAGSNYAMDFAYNCRRINYTGQLDCCDSDANAKPGQTSYFTTTNACGSWDYNCSGAVEKQYPSLGDATGCHETCDTITEGWVSSVPDCGQTGSWYYACDTKLCIGKTQSMTQACH
jgi:hypothetical protein